MFLNTGSIHSNDRVLHAAPDLNSFWSHFNYSATPRERIQYCHDFAKKLTYSDLKYLMRDVEQTSSDLAEFHSITYSTVILWMYKENPSKVKATLQELKVTGSKEDKSVILDFIADIEEYDRSPPESRKMFSE